MGSAGMARAAPASMEVIPLNTLEVLLCPQAGQRFVPRRSAAGEIAPPVLARSSATFIQGVELVEKEGPTGGGTKSAMARIGVLEVGFVHGIVRVVEEAPLASSTGWGTKVSQWAGPWPGLVFWRACLSWDMYSLTQFQCRRLL